MKITPLEIRQKTFEKVFRGLDKDEVEAFLQTLSQEWEKILEESKELRIKLEASEKEVEKLREVESSLFKTLKTAEDTGANMIDQANKTAELHMKETQMKAEALLSDAKNKARAVIEEAEINARQRLEETEIELKELAKSYKTLENLKDNLLDDLKGLTNDTMEKVKRATEKIKSFDVDAQLRKHTLENFNAANNKETEPVEITNTKMPSVAPAPAEEQPPLEETPIEESAAENPIASNQSEEAATVEELEPIEEPTPEVDEKPEPEEKAAKGNASTSFFDEI